MLVVSVELGAATLDAWAAWLIFAAALVAAFRYHVNAAFLVLGGAVLGWVLGVL